MQTTHNPIQAQMRNVADELRKLRDEIRVQVHLGSLEVKKAWDELEPKIAEADRLAENASEETFRAAIATLRKTKLFRKTLPRDTNRA
ncbi:MAG TPA: hypothetical protein VGH28_18320 [Polyangiaceae bacterium]|jgi:hypothetical protein